MGSESEGRSEAGTCGREGGEEGGTEVDNSEDS